jgi:hypothetical protein
MPEPSQFQVTLSGDGVQVQKAVPEAIARRILNLVMGGEGTVAEAGLERTPTDAVPEDAPKNKSGAKGFMAEKKPGSDVERVTCLAYFLTHHLNSPTFQTRDVSKLNSEAHQPKLSNPTVAVNNASRQRYLTPAGGGKKRITTLGEEVVRALPDREAMKKVLASQPGRRRKRSKGQARSKAKTG